MDIDVKPKLILLPDTNFFIQCLEPDQLSWREFAEHEGVELWLSRPVQMEIDAHKGKGSGRVSKRARAASSYIKKLIISGEDKLVIRANNPSVILKLCMVRPDPNLADELDYQERDCQLVGIASTVAKENPASEVRVLTQDIGPIASARSVGVGYFDIPEQWLLSPERDEAEKQFSALKAELDEYKQAEPKFEIKLSVHDKIQEKIFIKNTRYLSLSDREVSSLLTLLAASYPKVVDFSPGPRPERDKSLYAIALVTLPEPIYKDVSDGKKEKYSKDYDKWLADAELIFRNLHESLNLSQTPTVISVQIANAGTRPGTDCLVDFSCRGEFMLLPFESWSDKVKDAKFQILEAPPVAPKGEWISSRHLLAMADLNFDFRGPLLNPSIFPSYLTDIPRFNNDPGTFYWRPERPDKFVAQISLTCAQWRHQNGWENFDLILTTSLEGDVCKGVLEIQINAANLTRNVERRFHVEIETEIRSSFEMANLMISELNK